MLAWLWSSCCADSGELYGSASGAVSPMIAKTQPLSHFLNYVSHLLLALPLTCSLVRVAFVFASVAFLWRRRERERRRGRRERECERCEVKRSVERSQVGVNWPWILDCTGVGERCEEFAGVLRSFFFFFWLRSCSVALRFGWSVLRCGIEVR
ncbi:hypothetical protein KC19_12G168700 [Ceratodon purpureus]|uniref:Transmembrane protein n=1 Tax=Ceratodon purpureus TaxID=3225 RepID=A0A8T0G850_CERPU|nr:hypothetical protein KC19_12G168700 [Ceratodon purpureus]